MKDLADFLVRNFELKTNDHLLLLSHEHLLEKLRLMLQERVLFLLRNDMDRLLQALYRIDISDRDTDVAFELGDINKIAYKLSDLIITRQLKKYKYSTSFNNGDLS